jgi:hypothetical protein
VSITTQSSGFGYGTAMPAIFLGSHRRSFNYSKVGKISSVATAATEKTLTLKNNEKPALNCVVTAC